MPLEEHYSGDNHWNSLLMLHKKKPRSGETYIGNESYFEELQGLKKDASEILVVAVSCFGLPETKDWLTKKIPVLDNAIPLDCILKVHSSKKIKKRMREYFMRLPV